MGSCTRGAIRIATLLSRGVSVICELPASLIARDILFNNPSSGLVEIQKLIDIKRKHRTLDFSRQ